jgi:hypothetical protein
MLRNPNERDSRNENDVFTRAGEQLYVRSRSVVSRVIGGETLIVPVRGKVGDLASIYSFNGTGSLIWQSLESPKALADVIGVVADEYDVAREQAQEDAERFVKEMISLGLVDLCPTIAGARTRPEMPSNGQEVSRQEEVGTAESH